MYPLRKLVNGKPGIGTPLVPGLMIWGDAPVS